MEWILRSNPLICVNNSTNIDGRKKQYSSANQELECAAGVAKDVIRNVEYDN